MAAARQPVLFAEIGIPDTHRGRFEAICLFVALVIRRCSADADPRGADLAQAVFDAMFSDMDVNLREMGIGDLGVGKRVRFLWESFHGRAEAYTSALDAADPARLAAALTRNVWAGSEPPPGADEALAARTAAVAALLDDQGIATLLRGEVRFA
ncbi:MAG: ubiquinol-cytochrome C chaperone family protein [Sphingomonadaceae bacterium]